MKSKYPKAVIIIRMILFWILFIGLYWLGGAIGSMFAAGQRMHSMINGIAGTVAALLTVGLFLKIEKKSFAETGLVWEKGTLPRFLSGLVLGSILCSTLLLFVAVFSGFQLKRAPYQMDLWAVMGYICLVPLGFMEELAFRSYTLITLNKAFSLRVSQLIVAVAFALYHISMGWSPLIAFTGPFVWSFVFGLAAVRSNGISVPTGIHIALNAVLGLSGINGVGSGSFWKLGFADTPSKEMLARAGNIGVLSQLVVLVGVVLLMEFFVRRKSKNITAGDLS